MDDLDQNTIVFQWQHVWSCVHAIVSLSASVRQTVLVFCKVFKVSNGTDLNDNNKMSGWVKWSKLRQVNKEWCNWRYSSSLTDMQPGNKVFDNVVTDSTGDLSWTTNIQEEPDIWMDHRACPRNTSEYSWPYQAVLKWYFYPACLWAALLRSPICPAKIPTGPWPCLHCHQLSKYWKW